MTRSIVRILSIFIMLASMSVANAQNSVSSPYSMYGIGMLNHRENVAAAGLGHAGIALAPSEWVNISNPAGIAGLDSLSFYFNVQMKWYKAKAYTMYERQTVYKGNIDALMMGFRGTKWWSMAFGYVPYSSVGYNLWEQRSVYGSDAMYTLKHSGSGGLQQAFLTNAVTFFNHLSLGINCGVVWGTFERKESAIFSDELKGENVYNSKKYTCNNLFCEFGLQFDFNIGKYNNFRFGATYNRYRKMRSSYRQIVSNDISAELFLDNKIPPLDEFAIPETFGGGFAYTRKKFTATADFKYAKWSDVKNVKYGEPASSYKDTKSIGGGVEFAPGEPTSPFYKRMRYRAGYHHTTDYVGVHNVYQDRNSVTLGLTVPLGRSRNSVSVAYEYQDHGTLDYGLVKEEFHNFKFALQIREIWFMKSKFE
ncbi:MAG: hypothetical protein MJZ01_06485 [Bacteroidales bacterium]|nr:hypothetical protein [Bacteroidales bacterium]